MLLLLLPKCWDHGCGPTHYFTFKASCKYTHTLHLALIAAHNSPNCSQFFSCLISWPLEQKPDGLGPAGNSAWCSCPVPPLGSGKARGRTWQKCQISTHQILCGQLSARSLSYVGHKGSPLLGVHTVPRNDHAWNLVLIHFTSYTQEDNLVKPSDCSTTISKTTWHLASRNMFNIRLKNWFVANTNLSVFS